MTLQLPPEAGAAAAALSAALSYPGVFAALAPLDCIVPIADPRVLSDSLLASLPAERLIFRIPADVCADKKVQEKCQRLDDEGFRIMLDGAGVLPAAQTGARALSFDCAAGVPALGLLMALPGPHLARHVDSVERLAACRGSGFHWFAGNYAPASAQEQGPGEDGTSRKRLLALLGLLARDADSRELETLLKQDPALAYHLLKLVNSAAFALSTPIHSFAQAINLLGRRQLQRWLQLLLYTRQQEDGAPNPLLPLAAVRAAHMETLCKISGGDRDQQDAAFVAGVFSLLDALLGMPMTEIVSTLSLDLDVVMALLDRRGTMGAMLALVEQQTVTESALNGAGIDAEIYWSSLLQAYHWAIQVSRNL
ncbi:MAG TPA: HDOD domain-containing protein [Janthinobacterium sp.]|nr:HDOD domain-containing protein [Janthinobacterium sp.]